MWRSRSTRCGIGNYQRIKALAQVNPDPKAVIETSFPGVKRPFLVVSASSIGIEAAEQFPYFWMLLKTLSSEIPMRWDTASLIRRLA